MGAKEAVKDVLGIVVEVPLIWIIGIAELTVRVVFMLPMLLVFIFQGKGAAKKTGDFVAGFKVTKTVMRLFKGI
jgi:hypothetical protein